MSSRWLKPQQTGATRPRVGICLSRLDALTSKYTSHVLYWQVGASSPNLPMPTRGRVAPRLDGPLQERLMKRLTKKINEKINDRLMIINVPSPLAKRA